MRTQTSIVSSSPYVIPPVVLVVDESTDTLNMLCDGISDAGYIAIPANNGKEALKRLEYIVPDAVLLDATSPETRGFELGRMIKSVPVWTQIPVFFMIEQASAGHLTDRYESGGIDYIEKPLNVSEVIARLLTRVTPQSRA